MRFLNLPQAFTPNTIKGFFFCQWSCGINEGASYVKDLLSDAPSWSKAACSSAMTSSDLLILALPRFLFLRMGIFNDWVHFWAIVVFPRTLSLLLLCHCPLRFKSSGSWLPPPLKLGVLAHPHVLGWTLWHWWVCWGLSFQSCKVFDCTQSVSWLPLFCFFS